MAIESRNLPAGTRLVARYRKQTYVCTVEEKDGKTAYVLEDGRRFTSPSAAGSAVMGGTACNGWRFWSREGEEPARGDTKPAAPRKTKTPPARGENAAKKKRSGNGRRGHPLLHPTSTQEGVPDGERAWFCDACMAMFTLPVGLEPEACPQGHRADDPQFAAKATS